ncbi:hypothetical protein, partial [Shewanella sp. GutDb-MelDb]|uniref:hypothetical protein n=1 Tax=Shewanella sp. GutDb-MelDb TaxID=2058316 RepID=UPI001C60CBE1
AQITDVKKPVALATGYSLSFETHLRKSGACHGQLRAHKHIAITIFALLSHELMHASHTLFTSHVRVTIQKANKRKNP